MAFCTPSYYPETTAEGSRHRAAAIAPQGMALDWLALSEEEWTAVRLSLKVASVAMICSLPFGIFIAYVLARGRFWGKSLLNGLVHLPLILPPVVTGFLLLVSFGRRGPIGAFLYRTSPAKRRPFRRPSTALPRSPAATRGRCA